MGDLDGRVAVVTGSNTGIGKATALALAGRGARVVLACRSEAKTTPVVAEIVAETGNDQVTFLPLDLGDLDSVRVAAGALLTDDLPLDLLVNNAGVAGQRGMTASGFELTFGVNHVGHFLFTTLLLPKLEASGPARIVNVSSGNHFQAKGIDYDAVRRPTSTFVGLHEYNVSKLANVVFTQQLAQRCDPDRVTAFSVNPGPVDSDVWRRIPSPLYKVFRFIRPMKSTADGAKPTLHAATAAGIEHLNGGYFDDDCEPKAASVVATPELGRDLWERSEAWVAQGA